MKNRYTIILLILLFTNCGTLKKDAPWEGIQNNTLRVAVYEFSPDDEDPPAYRERIITAGKSRAALILVSHASLSMDRQRVTPLTDALLNRAITEIIENGRIMSLDCRETGYCLSLIEYDITALNNALIEINH